MLSAINESIRVLKANHERCGEVVKTMLDSYGAIAKDLTVDGHVHDEHIIFWVKGEPWDGPDDTRARALDGALVGQNALADLRHAENVMLQVEELHSFLQQALTNDERSNGWDEDLVESMKGALGHLAERLGTGEYLTRDDFAVWNWALMLRRLTRREDWLFKSEAPEISYIKDGPSGGWWERVRFFDGRLVDLAGLDVKHAHR